MKLAAKTLSFIFLLLMLHLPAIAQGRIGPLQIQPSDPPSTNGALLISPQNQYISGFPGAPIYGGIMITNVGASFGQFNVSVTGGMAGDVDFISPGGGTLLPGQSAFVGIQFSRDVAVMQVQGYTVGIHFTTGGSSSFSVAYIEVTYRPPAPDSDGDGIPDAQDDCPDIPGVPEYNGCTGSAPTVTCEVESTQQSGGPNGGSYTQFWVHANASPTGAASIESYTWNLNGFGYQPGTASSFGPLSPGLPGQASSYLVKVTVTDTEGLSNSATCFVTS